MNPEKSIAVQIVDLIRSEGLPAGSHLPAQMLADRLRVSRSPVNEALQLLHEKGVVQRQPNRGYFLTERPDAVASAEQALGAPQDDTISNAYFQIAEDLLQGVLPQDVSESQLKARYALTGAQLVTVLARIAGEGWVERRPGYGWTFSSMLTTPDSLLKSYRLRLALEPAALLEPGYRLDPQVLQRCRAAEMHLLQGGIEGDTADQLHDRGVRFHESLVEASGNSFFIDAIRRVNRVRRLLSYRSMQDRGRYEEHCRQHLHILDLLEQGRNPDAAQAMARHLDSTLHNLEKISRILSAERPSHH
ncbi:MAG: GntR family transcriptional regulator [Xylophilus ampelinus]